MLIFGASIKYTGMSELRIKKAKSRKDFYPLKLEEK